MAKAALVDQDERNGASLLAELDARGLDVRAAFWFWFSEEQVWRLVIAMPIVGARGPRQAYLEVGQILKELAFDANQMSLEDISLVPPSHHLVKLFRTLVRTGRAVTSIRFTRNVVNGVFIEDAYIYRVA